MIVEPDARFQEERARYHLRFTCEDCSYLRHEDARCAHGYPNAMHRAAAFDPGAAGGTFCKEFELA